MCTSHLTLLFSSKFTHNALMACANFPSSYLTQKFAIENNLQITYLSSLWLNKKQGLCRGRGKKDVFPEIQKYYRRPQKENKAKNSNFLKVSVHRKKGIFNPRGVLLFSWLQTLVLAVCCCICAYRYSTNKYLFPLEYKQQNPTLKHKTQKYYTTLHSDTHTNKNNLQAAYFFQPINFLVYAY